MSSHLSSAYFVYATYKPRRDFVNALMYSTDIFNSKIYDGITNWNKRHYYATI